MYNHAPPDYVCPLCETVAGRDNAAEWTKQSDVVLRGEHTTAFVAAMWWPNNPGHVIVIPNRHIENIYDMPAEIAMHIHETARQIAIAFKKVYGCDGTSTRQHNEPAGNQEVWHYHMHVFPRHQGDQLYGSTRRPATVEERRPYAEKLTAYFRQTRS